MNINDFKTQMKKIIEATSEKTESGIIARVINTIKSNVTHRVSYREHSEEKDRGGMGVGIVIPNIIDSRDPVVVRDPLAEK